MKTIFFMLVVAGGITTSTFAQDNQYAVQLQQAVAKVEKAQSPGDYQKLSGEFMKLAGSKPNDWLPWYYAAFCNTKIGFLYQQDGERIEPFSNEGEKQVKRALSVLDTAKQKAELTEVYTLMGMMYQTKVFVNPMTYGRQFGPQAAYYLQQARRLDPNNPRVLYFSGWMKYHTPKTWGGDKQVAKELLQKGIAGVEKEKVTANYPHWGRKECEALLKEY